MKKLLVLSASAFVLMGAPAFAQCTGATATSNLNCTINTSGLGAAISLNGTSSFTQQSGIAFSTGAAAARGDAFGQGRSALGVTGPADAAARAGAQGFTAGNSFSSSGPGTGSAVNTTTAAAINAGLGSATFFRGQ